jgi:GTP-binding protein
MTSSTAQKPAEKRNVDVTVVDAVFLRSAPSATTLPPVDDGVPEVAFLGKSNVGKSSLLNAMVLRKHLVKTSKTPGQTRLLNQFRVELQLRRSKRQVVLVDLPGYGFAKTSKSEHEKLGKMLAGYLGGRVGLSLLVHLFDLRHPPTRQDVQMWDDLSSLAGARIAVGTKADRVPASKKQQHAKVLAKALGIATGDVLIFSAETREGRLPLWGRILAGVDDGVAGVVDVPPAG